MIKERKNIYVIKLSDYKGGEISGFEKVKSLHEQLLCDITELYIDYILESDDYKEEHINLLEYYDEDIFEKLTDIYPGRAGTILLYYDNNCNHITITHKDLKEFIKKNELILKKEILKV